MKPIENKQPLENELIDHIRENLIEHEETYRPGAWEDFNKPEKKRRAIFWIEFMGVAAAILIIAFISSLLIDKKPKTNLEQLVSTKKIKSQKKAFKIEKKDEKNISNPEGGIVNRYASVKHKQAPILTKKSISVTKEPVIKDDNYKQEIAYLVAKNNDELIADLKNYQNQIALINKPITINAAQKPLEVTGNKKDDIIDILEKENKKNKIAKTKNTSDKKQGKFTFGIMLAPSFGSAKKLNMGYGLGVDYTFSEKLTITSGITYNQMGGAKNIENTNSILYANQSALISKDNPIKTLKYFEENVAGIDIPFEVKYHFNKSIYANAGVSALAVINQSRNNTYIEKRAVQKVATLANGTQALNASLVNQQLTEPTKIDNYSFLGFYNFSFGYKKKISSKNSFAIEPFIKLPMKEVRAESLRLMGTGVKLKMDF